MFSLNKERLVTRAEALPDRPAAIQVNPRHLVLGNTQVPPFPAGLELVQLAMGCFWGAERRFWQQPGVYSTAVGYAGGFTVNPSYQDVCSGRTAHTEVVLVVFDPVELPLEELLTVFWEAHDPTQGMRQGNDRGTQYRSAIYTTTPVQLDIAQRSLALYQQALTRAGRGSITTELRAAPTFYYAEDYHQQYLAKNPDGYCGLKGTGVACPHAN